MVTPAQKNGALFAPALLGPRPQVAEDGEHVIASSLVCFDGALSCTGDRLSKGPPYEFTHTSTGWQPHPLTPPASTFELNSAWGFSPDTGLVLYSSPVPSGETDEFYARQPDGTMQPIGPITENRNYKEAESVPRLATSDLTHLVYATKRTDWTFDKGEAEGLYEYVGVGNAHPFLVGVSGAQGSSDLISACDTALGAGSGEGLAQALSADGQIVFFTARKAVGSACTGGSGANTGVPVPADEVFARVDGEGAGAHTIAISQPKAPETLASTPADESCSTAECQKDIGEQANWRDALLQGASEDATKAVFLSTQQLTDTATQDPTGDSAANCGSTTGAHGCNLYLFDMAAPAGHNLIDVSAGDSSGLGSEVQGVMAVSGDGTHIYFIAKGVLSTSKNHAGQEATPGLDNLYLYERDSTHPTGHTTYITTLPGDEAPTPRQEQPESEQWTKQLFAPNVTTDGRVFVFASHGALTADATRARGPAQIYRYDAETEGLQRVSIGERGFNDNGNAGTGEARLASTGSLMPVRRDLSMSNDGSMVFFLSPVGLTPGALNDVSVNGRAASEDLAQNVYEWEIQGKGGCTQPAGCIHLISDGHDQSEGDGQVSTSTASSVELLGSDSTGENVFFATADPLVGSDTDTELDIYDARTLGGYPPPTTPIPCEKTGTCRGPGSKEETLTPFPSSTTTGLGNREETIKPPPKTHEQLRVEKLAKALKACKKQHNKHRRQACEKTARKRYAPPHKPTKHKHR
jgi:hypothetical protein